MESVWFRARTGRGLKVDRQAREEGDVLVFRFERNVMLSWPRAVLSSAGCPGGPELRPWLDMPGASYPGPKGIAAVLTMLRQGRQCWKQPETRPAACLREFSSVRCGQSPQRELQPKQRQGVCCRSCRYGACSSTAIMAAMDARLADPLLVLWPGGARSGVKPAGPCRGRGVVMGLCPPCIGLPWQQSRRFVLHDCWKVVAPGGRLCQA